MQFQVSGATVEPIFPHLILVRKFLSSACWALTPGDPPDARRDPSSGQESMECRGIMPGLSAMMAARKMQMLLFGISTIENYRLPAASAAALILRPNHIAPFATAPFEVKISFSMATA